MYIIDEIDQFVINSCIKGLTIEQIANTLNYSNEKIQSRIASLKDRGISVYPGMKGNILKERDFQILDLLNQEKTTAEIAIILKTDKKQILKAISNFKKLNIKFDGFEYIPQKNGKDIIVENNRIKAPTVVSIAEEYMKKIKEIVAKIEQDEEETEVDKKDEVKTKIEKKESKKTTKTESIPETKIEKNEQPEQSEKGKKTENKTKKSTSNKQLLEMFSVIDKKIFKLHKCGMNQTQIAEKIGCTKQEISRRVIRMRSGGVIFDTKKSIRKIQKDNVYKLVLKGLSTDEIASVLNMDENKVLGYIKNLRNSGLKFQVKRKNFERKKDGYQLDEIDKQIIELREQHLTLDEIAEMLGRAKITIAKRIQKMRDNKIEVPDALRRKNAEKLERDAKMIELYQNGMFASEIAKEYGVSKSLVWDIVHKRGIKKQGRYQNDEELSKKIVDLYRKGFSIKELGLMLAISHVTITNILLQNDVKIVWERKIKKSVRDGIVKLAEQGLSIQEIAEQYGCEQEIVGRVLKRNKKTKSKYYSENVNKEQLVNAIRRLKKSKNATEEQLAILAKTYGLEPSDVLDVLDNNEKER